MKVLALETSTMLGGVAVADEAAGLVAEIRLNVKTTHSERLMTAVDRALDMASLRLGEIGALAISIGPGSFTGLRIGLSTVKGLAFATGKPVVAVPTLEAFARSFAYARHPVCLMLDARKGEVYVSAVRWSGNGFERLFPDSTISPGELLARMEGPVIFSGDGAAIYRKKILEVMGERAIFPSADAMVPSPANVAMLGLERALRSEFSEAAPLVPSYLRKSEAEVKWLEKQRP